MSQWIKDVGATVGKIAAGSIVSASWSTKGFGGSAKGTRRFTLAPQ